MVAKALELSPRQLSHPIAPARLRCRKPMPHARQHALFHHAGYRNMLDFFGTQALQIVERRRLGELRGGPSQIARCRRSIRINSFSDCFFKMDNKVFTGFWRE